jgi:hypothetical protein
LDPSVRPLQVRYWPVGGGQGSLGQRPAAPSARPGLGFWAEARREPRTEELFLGQCLSLKFSRLYADQKPNEDGDAYPQGARQLLTILEVIKLLLRGVIEFFPVVQEPNWWANCPKGKQGAYMSFIK